MRARADRRLESELAEARRRISQLESELAQFGTCDPLTRDLLSLRSFRAQLELDVKRAQRYRRPFSVALIDVDGFRALNLRHGYANGDAVIVAIARTINEGTRANDLGCRTGGDEFAILLPETPAEPAVVAMQRLLRSLEDLEVRGVREISVSIGVASFHEGDSGEGLLAAAREALEEARAAGGGQVALYRGNEGEEVGDSGQHDVVAALASALQERDHYTGDHSESVVEMAARVADSLGLAAEEVVRVRTAALLHDIGKVGVPDEILHKAGPLDEREWEIMRQHPLIGERILRAIPGMGLVAKVVRHEHERWDGAGYPDGLSGEQIPIGSRIILACDAYHAMTSDRPYRRAMDHSAAIAELNSNAGRQFDPEVVQSLIGYLYGRRQSGALAV
jgi:diguanylate cyclase (GGDEF)-like protein/putative nucleotidyltransferase with HDIG domain